LIKEGINPMNNSKDISEHPVNMILSKDPPRDYNSTLKSLEQLILSATSFYSNIWITILGQYVFSAFFALIIFFLPDPPLTSYILGALLAYPVIFHFITVMFKKRHLRKIRFLLINGRVQSISVLDNLINYSRLVNDAPQRIICYEADGKRSEFKTYDHVMADEFYGMTPVLIHPRSKFIIPVSYLVKYKI
jgi:hypothetical protein